MSEPVPDREALETAQALTEALTGTREQVAALTAAVKRSRRHIFALAVSLLLDVALTVVVAIFAVQAHSASTSASHADATVAELHATQVAGCQAGNAERAEQTALWTHLAAISKPPPHLTRRQLAANKREIAALLAYVKHTFAPRDCQKAYRLP